MIACTSTRFRAYFLYKIYKWFCWLKCLLCLTVRDAAARLPKGEGTRYEICDLLKDSQFISDTATDNHINTVGVFYVTADPLLGSVITPTYEIWRHLILLHVKICKNKLLWKNLWIRLRQSFDGMDRLTINLLSKLTLRHWTRIFWFYL